MIQDLTAILDRIQDAVGRDAYVTQLQDTEAVEKLLNVDDDVADLLLSTIVDGLVKLREARADFDELSDERDDLRDDVDQLQTENESIREELESRG